MSVFLVQKQDAQPDLHVYYKAHITLSGGKSSKPMKNFTSDQGRTDFGALDYANKSLS